MMIIILFIIALFIILITMTRRLRCWSCVHQSDLDEAARSLKELEREIDSLFARSRLSQEAVSLKNAVMTVRHACTLNYLGLPVGV
jgi:uncharacterized protein YoxC